MDNLYDGMPIIRDSNGYDRVYFPEHQRAHKDGMVYVHILQAEKYLGRSLSKYEVVHHKDFDKTNNEFDNLMIFATDGMHHLYHSSLIHDFDIMLKRIDKVWYCFNLNESLNEMCPVCGKLKSKGAAMCIVCYNKKRRSGIPSRNELVRLLFDHNILEISRKYGISDNAVRKWCKSYGLPYKHSDIVCYRNLNKYKILGR